LSFSRKTLGDIGHRIEIALAEAVYPAQAPDARETAFRHVSANQAVRPSASKSSRL
jgi:L-fucose mutarotase/ribose pyranase (RbsD/FucU family)